MKKRPLKHTISTNPATYLRLIFIGAVSVLAVQLYASQTGHVQEFFQFHATNLGILYAVLVGFMTSEIITRRHDLDGYVAQELNKIRRLYHLSRHIALANADLGPWADQIASAIKEYLSTFDKKSFLNYEEGDAAFRKITYLIYGVPQQKLREGDALYFSLLETSATATEAREFIRFGLKNRYIGNFAWLILLLTTSTLAMTLVGATPSDQMSRLVTAFVVFNLFLILQLIFEYGRINKRKAESYDARYLENIARIGDSPSKTTAKKNPRL